MQKATLLVIALVAAAWVAPAATTAKHKTTKKKHTTTSASASKTPNTSAKSQSKTKTKGKKHSTVRSSQQKPTPERYKEIQNALSAKGYYRGESTGEWGQDSSDALKRFQADQNLMPDGKINSLSLIALGLGPKRLTARTEPASRAPATPPATQATPAASQ